MKSFNKQAKEIIDWMDRKGWSDVSSKQLAALISSALQSAYEQGYNQSTYEHSLIAIHERSN